MLEALIPCPLFVYVVLPNFKITLPSSSYRTKLKIIHKLGQAEIIKERLINTGNGQRPNNLKTNYDSSMKNNMLGFNLVALCVRQGSFIAHTGANFISN